MKESQKFKSKKKKKQCLVEGIFTLPLYLSVHWKKHFRQTFAQTTSWPDGDAYQQR